MKKYQKGWLLKSAFFHIFAIMLTDFRLRVFHTVALRRNFTRAAKDLGITQPAVSQNIAELEHEMRDTLFERERNGVSLTPKGEILFKYAEKILHLYDSLNTELVPSAGQDPLRIRIAACPIAVRFILPKAIMKFQEIHPHAQVSLLERADEEIEGAILDGEADLGAMESTPANLTSTPFATLSLSETGESMLSILLAYHPKSPNREAIQKFVLTAKTAL